MSDRLKGIRKAEGPRVPFGRFEIVRVRWHTWPRDLRWGRGRHKTTRRWHKLCHAPHTGTVLSGKASSSMKMHGLDLLPGTVFHIARSERSWVVGGDPICLLAVEVRLNRTSTKRKSAEAANGSLRWHRVEVLNPGTVSEWSAGEPAD